MTKEEFIEQVKKLNIILTKQQLEQLELYYQILINTNQQMNLTRIVDKQEVYLKHFYDSLTIVKIIDLKQIETLCDIGTGAGFPGIVLKVVFPHLHITLIDSLNKRVAFLKQIIQQLGLKNIEAIHARAEEYSKDTKEKFDIVTARAVAPLNILLEYSLPLVKQNHYFIAMKGNFNLKEETTTKTFEKLNSHIQKIEQFELPNQAGNRTLIQIKKDKQTNEKYPRKYVEIKKHPL